ncbi:MAG: DUF2341 domain-containing protein, partial [Methanofollis sp.]|uniref:DUF2341 domain-containing protein n=1 Tax=Methanofollis sp. TaxID=2052835 RepID=UPI002632003A
MRNAAIAPVADFSANVKNGETPLTVQFTDTSTGLLTVWSWDFGDNSTSSEQSPDHTYTTPGIYTVSLTVANDYGSNTATKTSFIRAGRCEYSQNISFSTGDTAVYQQDVVVHRTDGTAYEEEADGLKVWHIFVGDRCREDYGDVRFADVNGTPRAYYLWPDFTSEQARFHVRLENADQPGTLMVRYGDPAATTTSDGSATYLLFDQFDDPAVDSTKWEVVQNNGISVNSGKLHVSSGSRNFAEIFSRAQVPSGIIVQFRIQSRTYSTSLGLGNRDYTGNGSSIGLENYASNYQSAIYSGKTQGAAIWGPPRTWGRSSEGDVIPDVPSGYYTEEFVIAPDESLKERRDGGAWTVSSRYAGVSGPKPLQLVHYRGYGPMDLDYILVRTYSAAPPAATNFKPVASFTANTTSGHAPLTVQFNDTSLNSPSAWTWDFGDGGTSTEQNPVYTYETEGTYTVNLTATNSYDSSTCVKTDYITVGSGAPIGNFTVNVMNGYVPLRVQFTDTSTVNPSAWSWDFGDGATSTDQHPVHTYANVGNYTVSLTVTNNYGSDIETKADYIYAGKSEYSQNISYTAGDTAVYQQDVVVHRTDGTAYEEIGNGTNTWHLYVVDRCKADYGDVRFKDAVGNEFAYYLWPDFDNSSARFCVRLEGADQPGTLAVYYGNPAATTTSDGSATYLLYDNFDGPENAAPDPDLWESVKKGSSSATVNLDGNGNLLLAGAPNVISSGNAWTKPLLSRGVIIEYRDSVSAKEYSDTCYGKGGVSGVFDKGANTWWHTGLFEAYATWVQNAQVAGSCDIRRTHVSTEGDTEVLGATTSALYPSLNTFYTHRFEVQDADLNIYRDGTLIASASDTTYSGDGFRLLLSQGEYKTGLGGTRTIDYVLIRTYSATPPSATNLKPGANFTANTTEGNAPLTVQFNDTSTGSPTSWSWTFGDNTTSTVQHPTHTYIEAGNYTVTLTATNAAGSDDEMEIDYIVVGEPAAPDLTVSTLTPNCGQVFSAAGNTYTAKITNIGNADAGAFSVGFNVSGT